MKRGRPKTYWLYFLYDNDEVVYIGVTRDLKSRLSKHSKKQYNSARVEKHSGKNEAMYYERRYTILYKPKYSFIPKFLINHPDLGKLNGVKEIQFT